MMPPSRGRGRGRGRPSRNAAQSTRQSSAAVDKTSAGIQKPSIRGGRGRGGYRVKQSHNPRIQAIYHRKNALKAQFTQIALAQREALDALAQKSLDLLNQNAKYHETLPEFDEVQKELDKRYQNRIDQLNKDLEFQSKFLENHLQMSLEYERRRYKCKIDDIEEVYETRIKQEALYVQRQADTGGDWESTQFHCGIPGEVIKTIDRPPSILNSSAIPYDPEYLSIETNPYQPEIPASVWWKTLDNAERQKWENSMRKLKPFQPPPPALEDENRKKNGRSKSKNPSPRKAQADAAAPPRSATSLYQPAFSAQHIAALPDNSNVATPASMSEAENDIINRSLTATPIGNRAEDLPMDKFGVHVPNKPRPNYGAIPNNRLVSNPSVRFDSDEIGIRNHHFRKAGDPDSFLGTDASPNPQHLYHDRLTHDYDAAQNSPEDLDISLVETHAVHPTYGIAIEGSRNPEYPVRSNWEADLPRTTPVVFIEKLSGETFLTSRSAWIIDTGCDWEAFKPHKPERAAIGRLVGSLGAVSPKRISKEPPAPKQVISDSLLYAVNTAPPPTPPAPRARAGYDPVRDTGYVTPYQARVPAPSGPLLAMADAAEAHGRMGPPPRPVQPVPGYQNRRSLYSYPPPSQMQPSQMPPSQMPPSPMQPSPMQPSPMQPSPMQPSQIPSSQMQPSQMQPSQMPPPVSPAVSFASPPRPSQGQYRALAPAPPAPPPNWRR